MNVKPWIQSLAAAAIGGAATALGAALTSPANFNLTSSGLKHLLAIGIFGAIVPVLALLQKSPIPDSGATSPVIGQTQKLGALALCCLVLCASMAGCSQKTATTVANDVIKWSPGLQSAITTIDATAALLLPEYAPIFTGATAGFKAVDAELVAQAQAYLQNPTTTVLASLQQAVATFQQTINTALLQVAGIKDSKSQQTAVAAINGVGTIVNILFGEIQSISTKAELQRMGAIETTKLAQVRQYMDNTSPIAVAALASNGITSDEYFAAEARAGF